MLYACENPSDPEIVKLLLQHGAYEGAYEGKLII